MSLSIIIVNYRSWDSLEACLAHLAVEAEGQDWEIIVVDNHSDDGRIEAFSERFPGVRMSECPRNGGFAYGCNRGAELAGGRTLLFMNPDVVTEPGSVQRLLEIRRNHPDIAILSASQLDARGRPRKAFDMFPDKLTWFRTAKFLLRLIRPGQFPDPRRAFSGLLDVDWVSGSVFMIDRSEFERLGGWREDFWMYVEDCDFCLRARRKDCRVACTGDVRLVHHHGGSSRQNFAISVLTRTEAVISKHLYVYLNHHGFDRAVNQVCVFLAVIPKLAVFSLFDLLTLRRLELLRTRTGVLGGVFRYYAHVFETRDWRSPRVLAGKGER